MAKTILAEETMHLNGAPLTLQIGRLAPQVAVSVYAQWGDTVVLVTLAIGDKADTNYLPLQLEYVEKLYAGGIIKGSRWVKREGRPTDEATLSGRLIDRGIRPLFPKHLRNDIQIVATLLSVDGMYSPEILSSIAASAAIHVSALPWKGPLSTARVGYIHSQQQADGDGFVVNPTEEQRDLSSLDLVVSSTKDRVVMIETQAEQLSEDVIAKGIELAKQTNGEVIDLIEKLRAKVGQEKMKLEEPKKQKDLLAILQKEHAKEIEELAHNRANKERAGKNDAAGVIEAIKTAYPDLYDTYSILDAIDSAIHEYVRTLIIDEKKRLDGRKLDEIRELYVETSILPRTHGSAIFQRGMTQVLSVVTLGALGLEQIIEGPEGTITKRYMHHYNAPPYCYGDTGRMGSPGRREIGHGALAEKALVPVLPSEEEFPYVMRVVSEVLSSNGSTSMASTCGSTVALMDAGVPIKNPVAGISVGLVEKSEQDYQLMLDIMGMEDFSGDMDFKVAGTKDGITAIQLDVKNSGLTAEMIAKTLQMAKDARMFILDKMLAVLPEPRKQLSTYAPKVVVITPPEDKIGAIIGPGGKTIRNLSAKTNTLIDVSPDGKVSISGVSEESVEMARKLIEGIYAEVEQGKIYDGEVKTLFPFGAVVEFLPGREGLVHISRMGKGFVKEVTDVVHEGQQVQVKVEEVDQRGRISLSLVTGETQESN